MAHSPKASKAAQGESQSAVADDTLKQSERFIAKARELGLDEREETFDAALAKVARHKSVSSNNEVKSRDDTPSD